jgi:hypothetical protein
MALDLFRKETEDTIKVDRFGSRDRGIDLRDEFDCFVNGDQDNQGHGYWVVYRRFDTSQNSDSYNRTTGKGSYYKPTGEGVGGQSYPFEDELVRTNKRALTVTASRFKVEQETPLGNIPVVYRQFYLAHNVAPKQSDLIYEIAYEGVDEPTGIEPPYLQAWNINLVEPFRSDGGRIEFYACICGIEVIGRQ